VLSIKEQTIINFKCYYDQFKICDTFIWFLLFSQKQTINKKQIQKQKHPPTKPTGS